MKNDPILIEHRSVLLEEAIQALNPTAGKVYVDATLGGGGHTEALLKVLGPEGIVIGIDQDPTALALASERLKPYESQLKLLRGNFGSLTHLLAEANMMKITGGILMDLGVSDFQIKVPERGFSFMTEAALDMRMDPKLTTTAADLINTLERKDLANILYENADEKLSFAIAGEIIKARPLENTKQLADIAQRVYRQKRVKAQNIHPATRTFQALRMAVNQEIENLQRCLEQLPNLLPPGARVAMIPFHSIEDRTIKQFFRVACANCVCPPKQPICNCAHEPTFKAVGKAITPSEAELKRNPQSRSAKLRVYERIH